MYTGTRKFVFHYLGPLVVVQLYKDNFVQVSTLQGELISQPVHFIRLKMAKIRLANKYAQNLDQVIEILKSLSSEQREKVSQHLKTFVKMNEVCKKLINENSHGLNVHPNE